VDQSHLGAILRSDGTFQVTYFGHPLYLFSHAFTGTSGEGINAFGGTFKVISISGTTP
jgi:predicted lipoprotein with Yx(FWY)xxD motif